MYEKRDCYWIFETDGEVVGFCSQFRLKYVEVYFAFSSARGIVYHFIVSATNQVNHATQPSTTKQAVRRSVNQ